MHVVVRSFTILVVALGAAASPATAHGLEGTTLRVTCGGSGPLTTITRALRLLDPRGPSTVIVSGACHENVDIESFDRLTLQAAPGASISDASGDTVETLLLVDSRRVTVQGFTINGSVSCLDDSVCRFVGNTIQGGSGGVTIARSRATFQGDTVQNGGGLSLFTSADVRAEGLTVQGVNDSGILLQFSSFLDLGGGSVVRGNAGDGISIRGGNQSSVRLFGATISGNVGDGVVVSGASSVLVRRATTITSNGGAGVRLEDLSFGAFEAVPGQPNVVGGNGGAFDVLCQPQFSATRGALTNIGGGTTNCVEPP